MEQFELENLGRRLDEIERRISHVESRCDALRESISHESDERYRADLDRRSDLDSARSALESTISALEHRVNYG